MNICCAPSAIAGRGGHFSLPGIQVSSSKYLIGESSAYLSVDMAMLTGLADFFCLVTVELLHDAEWDLPGLVEEIWPELNEVLPDFTEWGPAGLPDLLLSKFDETELRLFVEYEFCSESDIFLPKEEL